MRLTDYIVTSKCFGICKLIVDTFDIMALTTVQPWLVKFFGDFFIAN